MIIYNIAHAPIEYRDLLLPRYGNIPQGRVEYPF